ncbi:hypothetical protein [Streptomyces sp. NPDC052114]|uniref:hypothetical protein n=1 Tax=unclassified Streptomyces TaxID=2593676 RepID=UPI0034281F8C
MSTPNTADTAVRVGFHYVLTVRLRDESLATFTDVIQVNPARVTRSQVYREIQAVAAQQIGYGGFITLFFALDREAL